MGEYGAIVQGGLAVGDAAAGVIGSFGQSAAIKSQAEYEAKNLEFNAQLAELQVQQLYQEARREGYEIKKFARQIRGAQRAAFAGQNIEVDSGSAALAQEDTERESTLDVLKLKNNAWRAAFGFKLQGIDYRTQAQLTRISGKQRAKDTIITGGINAAKGLIGTAYSLAGSYGGGGGGGGTRQVSNASIYSEAPVMY